jgi:hypothetical protein
MSRYGSAATERAFAGVNGALRWKEVVVEHDPEKWHRFSEKIVLKSKR